MEIKIEKRYLLWRTRSEGITMIVEADTFGEDIPTFTGVENCIADIQAQIKLHKEVITLQGFAEVLEAKDHA